MCKFFHGQVGTFATDKEQIKCAHLARLLLPMPGKVKIAYEFGRFRLDANNRILQCDGKIVPLSPKALDLLLLLVRHRDEVLDKQKIMESLWGDTNVEERNLTQQIFVLRKALSDGPDHGNFLETIPKRGYRFVAQVVEHKQGINGDISSAGSAKSVAQTLQPVTRSLKSKIAATLALVLAAGVILTTNFVRRGAVAKTSAISERIREARQQYQLGRLSWEKRIPAEYKTAIEHFEEAITLDADYAEAYAGLADSYILLASFGIESPNDVLPRARAAALRAIELNDRSAEAHASMGYLMSRFDWNWDGAEREFRRALELDPQYTTAHQWYALHLVTLGRTEEAISQIRTAQSLDPNSLVLKTDTALVLFYTRRYNDAVHECRRALQADASFGLAHRTLGAIYAAQRKYSQAISEFETATALLGRDPWIIAEIGRSYAMLGERQRALAQLRELHQIADTQFVAPSAFALLSASLSDRHDESIDWLEKEFDRHANVAMLTVHPGFDPIRNDPRFQDLLRRTGLPQASEPGPQ